MRTKTVKRYYCDFCSKGGFKKPDMANHEKSCTLNPKRICYMCGGGVDISGIIEGMRKQPGVEFHEGGSSWKNEDCWDVKSEEAITWLMGQVAHCPACVLSVLRQGSIFAFDVFDYKKEVDEWHSERSAEIKAMCGF